MKRSQVASPRFARTVLVVATALAGACTYQRAYLSYHLPEPQIPLATTPLGGEIVGFVKTAESGPVWRSCTDVARAALWVLMDETTRLGGNAIGDIQWFPEEPEVRTNRPCCRQRWGWMLVWPMLATPAFQTAKVEGTAYRLSGPQEATRGMYVIPGSVAGRQELVARIVDETRGAGHPDGSGAPAQP